MKFISTAIQDVFVIEVEPHSDERGFFARTFCVDEFSQNKLPFQIVQSSISFNKTKGTLRGMHFQKVPDEELRVVSVNRGSIFDVVIDLRPNSTTYKKFLSFELNQDNHKMIYVPYGVAHGFQTLEDNTEVHYSMNKRFNPLTTSGVRFDDPIFGIQWPLPVSVISLKDSQYPDFKS